MLCASVLSSVDGQVRLDPVAPESMPVRRYRDPRLFTGEQWRLSSSQPYPSGPTLARWNTSTGAKLHLSALRRPRTVKRPRHTARRGAIDARDCRRPNLTLSSATIDLSKRLRVTRLTARAGRR